MTLAICATDSLSLVNPTNLKRPQSSLPSCMTLIDPPVAAAWASDNTFLFLASSQVVHKYDPSTNSLKQIFKTSDGCSISNLLCKDKSTVFFSSAEKIYSLECGSIVKVAHTIESHKTSITSLSLSNDCTILASTSSDTVHVHNLTLGSHIVLKGLPSGQAITTSTFHPHTRTRLLLGVGKQLVIYDTTRPSGPLKTILLNGTSSGDIVQVACSPLGKTLIAAATAGGNVALIDLEKEKGLFRTLNMKVPVTSLEFSPDGGTIYLGTVHGKLLIQELRSQDKQLKTVTISHTGCRIQALSIQRKTKSGAEPSTRSDHSATSVKPSTLADTNLSRRPLAQVRASKPTASPGRARAVHISSNASPAHRVPSTLKEHVKLTPKRSVAELEEKKVVSPVRGTHMNSVGDISSSAQIETLGTAKGSTKVTPIRKSSKFSRSPSLSPKVSAGPSSISTGSNTIQKTPKSFVKGSEEPPHHTKTVSATFRTRTIPTTEAASVKTATRPIAPSEAVVDDEMPRARTRTTSSVSRTGSAVSAPSSRSKSSVSRSGSSISQNRSSSPVPPVPLRPKSRTPSPELPDLNVTQVTPARMVKGPPQVEALGHGTPEIDRWIRAGGGEGVEDRKRKGKEKGKTVGFRGESGNERDSKWKDEGGSSALGSEQEPERERALTMQVSPHRPGVSRSASNLWEASPLHRSIPRSPSSEIAGGSSAHHFLRTVVKDVMYDFQRETKAEMVGLHLDLVRMGRGWKRELRDLMQEYVGNLDDLREENRRLRAENELLRRGL